MRQPNTTAPGHEEQRYVVLANITTRIEIFQGMADIFIPIKFSEYLAGKAKDARLNLIKSQGHFYHLVYGYQTLRKVREMFYSGG